MTTRTFLAFLAVAACGDKPAPATPKAEPYETFDVQTFNDGCIAATRSEMTCDGPCKVPIKKVACPPNMVPGKTVILVMAQDLTCSVDGVSTPCPEHDTTPVTLPPEEPEAPAP